MQQRIQLTNKTLRLVNVEKPTLLSIKRETNVTTEQIAQRTNLTVGDVYCVEVGGHVSRAKAQKVVDAFNQLSGKRITVEDIKLLLPITDA